MINIIKFRNLENHLSLKNMLEKMCGVVISSMRGWGLSSATGSVQSGGAEPLVLSWIVPRIWLVGGSAETL